tara:strand:+ start:1347 stop:3137 length:1791 start_codon:yes stop_codon:yes gene_type:complete
VANQLQDLLEGYARRRQSNRLAGFEPLMTVGSAVASEVPALAVGLASLNTVEDRQRPFSEAVAAADEVRDMFTYNQNSMEGQAGMQSLINSVKYLIETTGLNKAFQVLNEEIIPRVQSTLGEDAARELGSMAMMIPAVKRVTKVVQPSADIKQEIIDPDKNLMFLQNTSPEALQSFDEIGGMPMPSLAVTKEDIPFTGFGEITLVGKPESFDPRASKTNEMFSADAYTVRAPRPMQLAKKNADDIFEEKYGTSKELDEDLDIYAADVPFELSEQSVKSRANSTSFNRIKDFFLRPDARKLFALDQGYERKKITKRDDPLKVKEEKNQELEVFLIGKDKELAEWRKNQIADLLEPEKVFVAKVMPETDYKPRRQKISPYTAEEVTKVMRKSSGPNQEVGFVASSVGAQRAATAEKIKSLKQARERKDQLQTKEALEDLKDTQNEMFFSIRNQLEKYYEFDSDNFRFTDEVGDLIKISERKGLDAAFREVGFKDVPDSLKDAINEYKDSLRSAPTQYFESKPKRVVDLSEFGGAIVPKGSEPQIRKILEKYGITRLKTYETDVERTAARKAFQDLMFSIGLPATVAGSIIYGEEDQSV